LLAATEDPNFERKVNEITEGMDGYIRKHLLEKTSRENASIIVEYIEAIKFEVNQKPYSKQVIIATLKQLSEFHENKKSLKDMTRSDILVFLDRLRKSDEDDPLHHWIGSYNTNVSTLIRFFRWLHYPLLDPQNRPKPECIQNVRKLKRKEKDIYKDSDLWTDPDCNKMFFRYVPSVRDRAFHAMMLDTSCRPKELMGAKLKDLEFKEKGYNQKFAYIWVTGKSGKRLKKLLIKSLPYLRDWLSPGGHPRPEDPNAYIFCGNGKRNMGRKLERHALSHAYGEYRKKLFPSLLKSPDVPDEDKHIIKEKILTKPMHPYILRHTSGTEKGQIMSEYELRQHMDWTITSNMPQRYLHFAGNEAIKKQLKAQGIISDNDSDSDTIEQSALRPPLICTNCREQNKPDAHFCANPKCGMVLSFKVHTESIAEAENMKKAVAEMQTRQTAIEEMFKKFIADEQDWNPKNRRKKN